MLNEEQLGVLSKADIVIYNLYGGDTLVSRTIRMLIGNVATALLARQRLERQRVSALAFLAGDGGPSLGCLHIWADNRDRELGYKGSALCCFLRDAAKGIEILLGEAENVDR